MLLETIDAHAGVRSDHPALITDQRSWSYAELLAEIDQFAAGIDRCVATRRSSIHGDRPPVVAVLLADPAQAMVAILACERAQTVAAALHPSWWHREQTGVLDRLRPDLVVADRSALERVPAELSLGLLVDDRIEMEREGRRVEDGVAFSDVIPGDQIRFSGGTSGDPAGAVVRSSLSAATWLDDARRVGTSHPAEALGRDVADRVLEGGGTVRFIQRWQPTAVLEAIGDDRLDALAAPSTHLERLAARLSTRPAETSTLAVIESSGGILHRGAANHLRDGLGAVVRRAYRHSAIIGSVTNIDMADLRSGDLVDQLDVGTLDHPITSSFDSDTQPLASSANDVAAELTLSGKPQDDDEATLSVESGDLAVVAGTGLRVLGRRDDRFTTDGRVVFPAEVEAAIAEHPGVAAIAVVGRPDDERGSVGVAVIVPNDPEDPPFLSDLAPQLEPLAGWAHPRAQWITAQLPLAAHGAVHRRLLAYEEASR